MSTCWWPLNSHDGSMSPMGPWGSSVHSVWIGVPSPVRQILCVHPPGPLTAPCATACALALITVLFAALLALLVLELELYWIGDWQTDPWQDGTHTDRSTYLQPSIWYMLSIMLYLNRKRFDDWLNLVSLLGLADSHSGRRCRLLHIANKKELMIPTMVSSPTNFRCYSYSLFWCPSLFVCTSRSLPFWFLECPPSLESSSSPPNRVVFETLQLLGCHRVCPISLVLVECPVRNSRYLGARVWV